MVIYTLSEQPNCWNVHRHAGGVTAVATVHSEIQAAEIALAKAQEEAPPCYVMRIGMNGQTSVISYFKGQAQQ